MPNPVKLSVGLVLVAWGFADFLFPQTVLRLQSDLLNVPSEPEDGLAAHKRRVGLVCILVGIVAVVITFS